MLKLKVTYITFIKYNFKCQTIYLQGYTNNFQLLIMMLQLVLALSFIHMKIIKNNVFNFINYFKKNYIRKQEIQIYLRQ